VPKPPPENHRKRPPSLGAKPLRCVRLTPTYPSRGGTWAVVEKDGSDPLDGYRGSPLPGRTRSRNLPKSNWEKEE